jgi:hypothetical protein
MENFDYDINNYSFDDYVNIFKLNEQQLISKEHVDANYNNLIDKLRTNWKDKKKLGKMTKFLSQCKTKLILLIEDDTTGHPLEDNIPDLYNKQSKLKSNNFKTSKDTLNDFSLNKAFEDDSKDYKLINSDFTPDLNYNNPFQSNSHFVIKKGTTDEEHTNKINPMAKNRLYKLLNINTRFRKNYYNSNSTDFLLDLPEEFKNVTSLTVVNVQIPNSNYTFTSKLGTNEFTIEIFDIKTYEEGDEEGDEDEQHEDQEKEIKYENHKKINIKILNGIYTGELLEQYLNECIFKPSEDLNSLVCKYDEITKKFRFLVNPKSKKGFNIDWRIEENKSRPIQLNMGWILGYRQQYYNWENDYILPKHVTPMIQEGFNPEAVYDTAGSKYFILSIDDYNNNYSNTLTSPFQESVFNYNNAMAIVPNKPTLVNFDDIFYQSRRNYFGPVNIKKLKIKLLDELGRVVDLNNNDFSFSLQIDQLYDIHTNK